LLGRSGFRVQMLHLGRNFVIRLAGMKRIYSKDKKTCKQQSRCPARYCVEAMHIHA